MTATALRPLPVPDTAPPIELDELPLARVRNHGPVQGVLRLVGTGGIEDDDDDFGPVPTSRKDLPDPTTWSRGLVQVLVEVVNGHRPCTQLLRWTTSGVYERIRRETLPTTGLAARHRRRPLVRSVHVCEPADGVAEVSAVVSGQFRTHAMALRLEGHDGRWRVTAFETS